MALNKSITNVSESICKGNYQYSSRWCYIHFSPPTADDVNFVPRWIKGCFIRCGDYFDAHPSSTYDEDTITGPQSIGQELTTGGSQSMSSNIKTTSHDEDIFKNPLFKVLLPTVMVLIAICFVLGVILIIKSYMMTPLKQNLATAIRRRRRVGHAPDNQYIQPTDMRASYRHSDRKSLPPPEVLIAARERASQIFTV